MVLQCDHRQPRQRDLTTRPGRLGLRQRPLTCPWVLMHRCAHMQRSVLEVDVAPSQPQHLTLPHAAPDGKHIQRFVALA